MDYRHSNRMDLSQKELRIADHFRAIMQELGLDVTDPGQVDTPNRVAKMYVRELCAGLNTESAPGMTVFPNDEGFDQIVLVDNITLVSLCQHHFLPFVGVCHVAYLPTKEGKILGLSKFNRYVRYLAAKPQVQERLTQEIYRGLCEILNTEDVAVVIKSKHLCCSIRGARDVNSATSTSVLGGKFRDGQVKEEFFNLLQLKSVAL